MVNDGPIRLRLSHTQIFLWAFLFIFASPSTSAQELVSGPVYVTAASGEEAHCDLIEPERHPQLLARFRDSRRGLPGDARLITLQSASTWNVSLNGFSEEAGTALQFAVDIWAALLSSPVTIEVEAEFVDLENSSLLGGAGPAVLVASFPGAAPDTFYPVSLANALAGSDLSNAADIRVSINSGFSRWYFGTDRNPASNEVDLVSVVLHELGHGLGFSDSFGVNDSDRGSWGIGSRATIYDRFPEDGSSRNLVDTAIYPQFSIALGNALSNNSVFFVGANTAGAMLFLPSLFSREAALPIWTSPPIPLGVGTLS